MDFMEMMGAVKEKADNDKWAPPEDKELALARLDAAVEEYNKPCQFKVGDIVTPTATANIRGRGVPHKVLEVYKEPKPGPQNPGSPYDENDVKVAVFVGDHRFTVFENRSIDFELWDINKDYTE